MSQLIHLAWTGPFSIEEIRAFSDDEKDFGVYSVYGNHPVYGIDVLLYIGKAQQQTFAERITQHPWRNWVSETGNLSIYISRLCGPQACTEDQWDECIDLAERLLIFAHSPAFNSSGLNTIPDERMREIHVLNWGQRRSLLPEVTGALWSQQFDDLDFEKVFTVSGCGD